MIDIRPGEDGTARAPIHTGLAGGTGIALLGAYTIAAVTGLLWTPYPPGKTAVGAPYSPPSGEHLFGTDGLGRDVFSQVLAATSLDLFIVVAIVTASFAIGTFWGTIAGYFGGLADTVILRGVEIVQAFPTLLLAIFVAQLIGPGIGNVVLVLIAVGAPYYARLARQGVLARRQLPYAEAARIAGSSHWGVAFRHLLPNSLGPLIANTSIHASWVVLSIAGLGFLGVGLPAGTNEWGAIISQGQNAIVSGKWWVSFFPGLALVGATIAFYLIGDALSDGLDPRTVRGALARRSRRSGA